LLKNTAGAANKYILTMRAGAAPLAELARAARPGEIVLMVGPEGDWTDAETGTALEAGFVPASLGALIMRSETAALAAAATIAAVLTH